MEPMRQLGLHRYHRNVAIPLVTNCTANEAVASVSPRLRTLLGDSQPREEWRMWGAPPGGRAAAMPECARCPRWCPRVLVPQEHPPSGLTCELPANQPAPLGRSEQISTPGPAKLKLGCVLLLAAGEGCSPCSREVLSAKGCKIAP